MIIQIRNTSLTSEELKDFIEFHDFDQWKNALDVDKSHFVESEGTDEVVSIVVDDENLYDIEITDFVDTLISWLNVGTEITVTDCDKVKVKAHKTKNGGVEMQVE